MYKHRDSIKKAITDKRIIWFWFLFAVVFVIFRPLKESLTIGEQDERLFKLITYSSRKVCQLIYATIGTMAFYCTQFGTRKKQIEPFHDFTCFMLLWHLFDSTVCYGVNVLSDKTTFKTWPVLVAMGWFLYNTCFVVCNIIFDAQDEDWKIFDRIMWFNKLNIQ